MNKILKIGSFIGIVLLMMIILSLSVFAEEVVFKNEKAIIDFSDITTTGTVEINLVEKTDKRIKIAIEKGEDKYTYDLKNDGSIESFPLQMGNGEYTVKVYKATEGSKYVTILVGKCTVKFKDDNAVFLNSSQFVNYNKDSKIVKKAAELVKDCKTDLEKVEAIYKFVIKSLTYDYDKAKTVQSGYLPSVDAILDLGKGICFDYSAVFASMLRSQGIPAKLVTGYVTNPNPDVKEPVYHAWNEFYLKGVGWFTINEMKLQNGQFERVDATFDSTGKSDKAIIKFISDSKNYIKKYEY